MVKLPLPGMRPVTPVGSREVIGSRTLATPPWTFLPTSTPATPRPNMPSTTRRPTGVPSGFELGATPTGYGHRSVGERPPPLEFRVCFAVERRSDQLELGVGAAGGSQLHVDVLGDRREHLAGLALRLLDHDRA